MSSSSGVAADAGQRVRFHDLVFDEDLLNAVRDDGATLRLTRQERALLRLFTARSDRLLTRDQLMAALSDDPGETSDRNVDFIVNRLRRKLRDPARAPRFIATQYGEGYVWIAPAQKPGTFTQLLVIGPVRGAEEAAGCEAAQALLTRLRLALEARTAAGHRVVLRPDWRAGPTTGFRFSLEVSFLVDHGAVQGALALRDELDRQLVWVRRLGAVEAIDQAQAAALADSLISAIWRHVTVGPSGGAAPTDEPLLVRMQDAVALLSPLADTWLGIEPQLVADREAHPEDPKTALMWAMNLYARLAHAEGGDPAEAATYERIEDEIEGLVFASLPALEGETEFALAAAKLLLCVHRGHADLAERIAEAALASSAAFAAALPVMAQARAARGDLAGALLRYDEALELCDGGSEFELYLLLLKCEVLLAMGDRVGANAVFERVKRIKPATDRQLGLFFLHPGEENLTAELRLRLGRLTARRARALIGYQYYMIGRFFSQPEHVWSIMAGPLDQLVRRFGPDVVPEAVWAALPDDVAIGHGAA